MYVLNFCLKCHNFISSVAVRYLEITIFIPYVFCHVSSCVF